MKKQAKQMFWNATLLTAASLFMRTASVSFQVYVSNRAGAEAIGLFSLMSGVYGFALTLATSGIQFGVTRIVTEAIGEGRSDKLCAIMRRAVIYALCFGVGAMLLLIGLASPISRFWLKDSRTVTALRLFAVTLPLISLASVWNGYFTAVRRTYKNAAVQVFEQGLKIFFSMYLLTWLLPKGIEATCCALVLGGVLAETASFALNLFLYLSDRHKHRVACTASDGRQEGKKLIKIALPIAFTTYIRSGLVTLQHILIPEGLRNSGSSHGAALAAYGSIHSMALPVILYPAALIASFSGLLIPELAECNIQKSQRRIRYMIARVWWLALLFSIGAAGILICFSSEIGEALYPNTDTGKYIRILAPLIPIMYIDTATDAMMKGLGAQVYSMAVNIVDALISVIMVWILIPRYGINGYLITIYFSETFNTVFSITHLLSISNTPVHLLKWVYKPLLCIVGATSSVRLILLLTGWTVQNVPLSICLHCVAVLAVYLLLLRLTGAIEQDDVEWFETLFQKEKKPKKQKQSQTKQEAR